MILALVQHIYDSEYKITTFCWIVNGIPVDQVEGWEEPGRFPEALQNVCLYELNK